MSTVPSNRFQLMLSNAASFALVLWAGAMWAAGYAFAPALFGHFPSTLAGEAAGVMFNVLNMLALGCAMLILIDLRVRFSRQLQHQPELWWVLTLIFLVLVQYLGLAPKMASLKPFFPDAQAMTAFARLHGISQVIYMVQSGALAYLVWRRLTR